MEFQRGFQKLISVLPKEFTVLDVGSGGLQGENTTNYLIEHFRSENIMGVCWADVETKRYLETREATRMVKIPIFSGNFYKMNFVRQYDLVVLDMNIESNLEKDWSDEGLARVRGLVKDGGYLINYIMLTDQYGDPEKTPQFIRERWKKWWRTDKLTLKEIGMRLRDIKGWEVFAHDIEERREYILWIMLKKTSGL